MARCLNSPICRNRPRTKYPRFCASCKALLRLLAELRASDRRHDCTRPEAEEAAARLAVHRARANGVLDPGDPRAAGRR